MRLDGKVVVITGASTGIGKELGFQFARKGCSVVLAARHEERLKENASSIEKAGGKALAVKTDVSIREEVDNLLNKAFHKFGRIDILINNAGISPARGTLLQTSENDVRAIMNVNFFGGVYGVWAAVPYIEKSGGGQIVFVSSVVGKRGIPFNSAYCASKFAIQGLTESLRPELARKNIRVITVCPPGVDTPFYENNGRGDRRNNRLHPVGRISKMIVRACEKEKREVLLTIDSKLLHYLNVFFPRLLDWAIAKAKGV